MGTNCAPFLIDFFLYSYQAGIVQGPIKQISSNEAT